MKNNLYKSVIATLILTLQFYYTSKAQNLVNNPGFENYSSCPTEENQLNLCTGWNNCNEEYYPSFNCASPDYLNTCGTGRVQLPNSFYGTVYPHNGNGIAAYTTYDAGGDYREYLQTHLTSPLVIGQTYLVTYYLTTGTNQAYDYHTNNEGVLFSTDSVYNCTAAMTWRKPQYNDTSIFDTSGWKLFTFEFTADSSYKYILFGDFFLDAQSKIEKAHSTGNEYSQIFVDDISVTLDTTVCNTTNLVNNPGFENYSSCPSQENQLNLCTGWNNCNGLYYPSFSCASPDYLNTCGSGRVQLPNSFYGTVYPHNGNGIAAYTTYDAGGDYREYLQTHLTSPLVIGQSYLVSYYLTTGTNQAYDYHTNNEGVLFATDSVYNCNAAMTWRKPQYNDTSIFDTSGWKLFTFEFTADSAYKYILFGDFYLDAQSKIEKSHSTGNEYSQIFVDDISVTENCNNTLGIYTPVPAKPTVVFYPDPVSNYATFNFNNLNTNTNPLTFTLYNCLGQQVKTVNNINAAKFIFNRGSLSAGMYFYKFNTTNGGYVASGKMILN